MNARLDRLLLALMLLSQVMLASVSQAQAMPADPVGLQALSMLCGSAQQPRQHRPEPQRGDTICAIGAAFELPPLLPGAELFQVPEAAEPVDVSLRLPQPRAPPARLRGTVRARAPPFPD